MGSTSVYQYVFTSAMYFVYMVYWNQLLELRFEKKISIIAEIAGMVPYIVLSLVLYYKSILRTVLPLGFILAEVLVLYRTPWYQNVLAYFLTILCDFVGEILIPGTLMTSEEVAAGLWTLPAERQILIITLDLLLNLILLFALNVAWKSIQKRQLWAIPGRVWAIYLLIPVSQFYMMMRWTIAEANVQLDVLSLMIAVFVCVGADIALIFVILRTADYAMLNARNEVLEEQIQFQKNYYATLTEQYARVRKMRHDINNHVFTMQSLLKLGEVDQAREYLGSVEEAQKKNREAVPCDNTLAAAFLSGKANAMQKAGIRFDCRAEIPSELTVSDLDLITALGNLCDNAQEAVVAAGVTDPEIKMTLTVKNGFLMVTVNNPAPAQEHKNRRIPELERGIGTGILKELAAKYDGEYTMNREKGSCNVSLVLKL